MRTYPLRGTGAALAGLALFAGCSSAPEPPAPPAPASASASTAPNSAPPAPAAVGVSPGGVTTAVAAPAESTEDDYFQACRAARTWMERRGADAKAQIEPYLKTVQSSESTGPATFGKRWSELSAGQQSAVIVAVRSAADALCG